MRSDGGLHRHLREKSQDEAARAKIELYRAAYGGGVAFDWGAGAAVVYASGARRLMSYSGGPVTFLDRYSSPREQYEHGMEKSNQDSTTTRPLTAS